MHSGITTISTKYGLYQVKAYKDGDYEYIAIMSRDFFDLKTPIVYIHSELHTCEPNDHMGCLCNNQVDIALKTVYKEGGLVIYHSPESSNIDGLMREINARKLQREGNTMRSSKSKLGLKAFGKIYHTIGFILKDLNLSSIKLVTNDPKDMDVARQLGIDVRKRVVSLSYSYGD